MANENFKDVLCERCGRVIGQRDDALYKPAGGAETIYHKSSRIKCPFVGCEIWQIFAINRNKIEPKALSVYDKYKRIR